MQTETPSPPSKPRLRWYQYRLRTLLILMTLLAVWMSWISHRARQQKLAVEKILALGGTVKYDFQIKQYSAKGLGLDYVFDINASPPGPEWLRKFTGDDYFQNVVVVSLSRTSVTDNDLTILENLHEVKYLALNDTKITGKGLVHLEVMKNLEHLFLHNTLIDDSGLIYLKNMTALRGLLLSDTKITDAGVMNLQGLTNLEKWLWLDGTQITDESLKYFINFKKLKVLLLMRTRVTEKGAKDLQTNLPKTKILFHHLGSCLD